MPPKPLVEEEVAVVLESCWGRRLSREDRPRRIRAALLRLEPLPTRRAMASFNTTLWLGDRYGAITSVMMVY